MLKSNMAIMVRNCFIVLLLMTIVTLFSSCVKKENKKDDSSEDKFVREIRFEESVTDKERANEIIEIADKYFVNELKADLEEFGSLIVSFNNETKEWTVFYLPGRPEEAIFDGDFWLVISNEKSEVVDVGFGG